MDILFLCGFELAFMLPLSYRWDIMLCFHISALADSCFVFFCGNSFCICLSNSECARFLSRWLDDRNGFFCLCLGNCNPSLQKWAFFKASCFCTFECSASIHSMVLCLPFPSSWFTFLHFKCWFMFWLLAVLMLRTLCVCNPDYLSWWDETKMSWLLMTLVLCVMASLSWTLQLSTHS